MLNTFPALLTYGFFAPTLLRLGVAALFAWSAWMAYKNRNHFRGVKLPFVEAKPWMPVFAALAELALAAMFLTGWHTQIAAILGILAAIKYAIYRRWWPGALGLYFPLSPGAVFLVLIICLSLLLSGAGAMAFDLPL